MKNYLIAVIDALLVIFLFVAVGGTIFFLIKDKQLSKEEVEGNTMLGLESEKEDFWGDTPVYGMPEGMQNSGSFVVISKQLPVYESAYASFENEESVVAVLQRMDRVEVQSDPNNLNDEMVCILYEDGQYGYVWKDCISDDENYVYGSEVNFPSVVVLYPRWKEEDGMPTTEADDAQADDVPDENDEEAEVTFGDDTKKEDEETEDSKEESDVETTSIAGSAYELRVSFVHDIKEKLEEQGYLVLCTDDETVTEGSITGASKIADLVGADVLVTIDTKKSDEAEKKGIEIIKIPEDSEISFDEEYLKKCDSLSEKMQIALKDDDKFSNVKIVQSAVYEELNSANIPAILIFMGYLSNDTDKANLLNEDYIDLFAEKVSNGIRAFFEE